MNSRRCRSFSLQVGGETAAGSLPRRNTAQAVPEQSPLAPHGYTAAVSGARVVSAPNARYLVLRPVSHGNTVRVRLTPAVDRSASRATTHRARITLRCSAACFSALNEKRPHTSIGVENRDRNQGETDDKAVCRAALSGNNE